MSQGLSFRVQGSFVTSLARERLYHDYNLKAAMDLLMKSTVTDELSEPEHIMLCVDILEGRKKIDGTYPDDDYGVYDDTPTAATPGIQAVFSRLKKKADDAEAQLDSMARKFNFLTENLEDYRISDLNRQWHDEVYAGDDEEAPWLFPDHHSAEEHGSGWDAIASVFNGGDDGDDPVARVERQNQAAYGMAKAMQGAGIREPSGMLDDFLKAQRVNKGDDYGWLDPKGGFHPVDWGEHQGWAADYVRDHPEQFGMDGLDRNELHSAVRELRSGMAAGDTLTANGWILLHSTHHGVANVTRDESKRITKAQREFLFGYYTDRGIDDEARAYLPE